MKFDWVIGSFKGKRAESVDAHAQLGVGYLIMESSGKGASKQILAAFRRPQDSPIPDHLQKVTDEFKIKKLDERFRAKSGGNQKPLGGTTNDKQG